jgi:hypothetical protein
MPKEKKEKKEKVAKTVEDAEMEDASPTVRFDSSCSKILGGTALTLRRFIVEEEEIEEGKRRETRCSRRSEPHCSAIGRTQVNKQVTQNHQTGCVLSKIWDVKLMHYCCV